MREMSTTNTRVAAKSRTYYLSIAGIFTALITIMTAYLFHIPVGVNGGYIHFGDSMIYLAAVMLPPPYGILAAGIGGALADLLSGAALWAPATFIIKMLITIPFTRKAGKIVCVHNVIGCVVAFLISGIGYYFAEAIIFGTKAAFLASMSGSIIQSGGSAICFIVFGFMLDRINFRQNLGI